MTVSHDWGGLDFYLIPFLMIYLPSSMTDQRRLELNGAGRNGRVHLINHLVLWWEREDQESQLLDSGHVLCWDKNLGQFCSKSGPRLIYVTYVLSMDKIDMLHNILSQSVDLGPTARPITQNF